jgi:hypothetical protein
MLYSHGQPGDEERARELAAKSATFVAEGG